MKEKSNQVWFNDDQKNHKVLAEISRMHNVEGGIGVEIR